MRWNMNNKSNKTVAIVLAAGQGKRMNSEVAKQYMLIKDKPVLYYSLKAFEESCIDEVVLVVGAGETQYCRKEIVLNYGFKKVVKIVEGGLERYHSVYNGLLGVENADYVLIHDGARPFLTTKLIHNIIEEVEKFKACVVGVPSKDTIKIVNDQLQVVDTPDRSLIWNVQTPQAFEYKIVREAYDLLMKQEDINVTDDAMVVEAMSGYPIHMMWGTYQNIKITTPEDIMMAELFITQIE